MKKLLLIFVGLGLSIGLAATDSIDFNRWTIKLKNIEQTGTELGNIDFSSRVMELIRKLNFDGDFKVGEYLSMNPRIARRFDRIPMLARPVDTKYLSDGTVSAEYELSITGTILKTIMPKTGGGIPLAPLCCPVCKRPWPENLEIPEGVTLIPIETEPTTSYTGIVIDATGLKLKPALFPKILNEEGKEVYSLSFVSDKYVQESGLISYVKNQSEAYLNDRAGLNPLRIDALRVNGRLNSDIIITNFDAERMHQSQRNLKLLEYCKVVVITGE